MAQSGGPSPVINSSLQGVITECCAVPDRIGTIYAAWHGIEGVLLEELVDMGRQSPDEIALLATTPAAGAVSTCRYKLTDGQAEDFEPIVDVLKAHDIGYFFYIGGNDSMDTAANNQSQGNGSHGTSGIISHSEILSRYSSPSSRGGFLPRALSANSALRYTENSWNAPSRSPITPQ